MEKTLLQKLLEIQKECKFFKKDKKSYNYNYVNGATIYTTMRAKMDELGVLLETHMIDSPELHIRSDKIQSNKKISEYNTELKRKVDKYIPEEKIVCERVYQQKCEMVWIDVESGTERKIPWLIVGEQDEISKAFGSGLTYCQRYFALNYFNIPTDENDPDNPENQRNGNVYVNRAPQKPSGMKMRWGDNKGALISELGDLQDLRKHLNWSTGKPDLVDYNKALQERMNYFAQKVEDDK